MRYQSPNYELTIMEVNDVIATSNKFEIVKDDDGNGKVTVSAKDLFR